MNTPAHLAASLLVWRHESNWFCATAVAAGAILPDLPMFGFYAYQKLIGNSESEIWSTLYFTDHWQYFFDIVNSIPLAILLIVLFRFWGWRWAQLLVASALLHMVCDLPLHHDDGHRHFLPLTNWRFESPVSYWDPNHFGLIFVWVELLFAIGACVVVVRRGGQPMRRFAIFTLVVYALAIALAVAFLATRL